VANDPWGKAFADDRGRNAPAAHLAALAERFAAAASGYLAQTAAAPAAFAPEAANTFSNFLRDQAMGLFQFPWSGDSAVPPTAPAAAPWTAFADAPALGSTREHQLRSQRAADAARRVADAQRRLQCLWSDALRDASVAFAAQMAARTPGKHPDPLRNMYDAWIDCAEQAYASMAHGEAFCAALAEFVNAGSLWRQEVAESLEQWTKMLDLPTRNELNSLHTRLRSVEAELYAAERRPPAQAAPKQAAPARPRAGAPKSARLSARKHAKGTPKS
jgi:hypothetical protein